MSCFFDTLIAVGNSVLPIRQMKSLFVLDSTMIRRWLLLSLCATNLLLPETGRAEDTTGNPVASEPWQGMFSEAEPEPSADKFWVRGEYLLWLSVSGKLLNLAQADRPDIPLSGSSADSGGTTAGMNLQQPFGSDRQGYRFSGGAWLDDENIIGIDGSMLYLTRDAGRLVFNPGDKAILGDNLGLSIAVPVLQRNPLRMAVVPVRVPDLVKGGLAFEFGAKTLFGTELAARFGMIKGETWRIDGLAGYQYLEYRDAFRAVAGVSTVAAFLNPGTTLFSRDDVTARSTYNGLLLGFVAEAHCDRWTFSARPRVSIADSQREVNRLGTTQVKLPDGTRLSFNEGTYVLKSDAGTFKVNEITAIPELDLGISFAVTPGLRLFAGTSSLFFPVVAKSNNQVQLGVRPDRLATGLGKVDTLPPINAGQPPIRNSLLFMTMSLGLEWSF